MKSENKMTSFFVIVFLHYAAANFAHPITPTLIVELQLPSYTFGTAFATMALTSFLFSPFWAKMKELFSARLLLLTGSVGYGLGQFFFGLAATEIGVIFARAFSGFFVGAIGVALLIYITEMSGDEKSAVNLAKYAIIQALGGAAGFLLGGVIGVYSIKMTVWLQAAALILCGVFFFLMPENITVAERRMPLPSLIKEMNPIRSFLDCRSFMTKSFALLFIVIAFANIGITVFDQAFNFYLKAQFNLTSIYNGFFKAAIGLITLLVNSTVGLWIIRRGDIKKAAGIVPVCCAVSISALFGIFSVPLFLTVCFVYYSFHSLIVPLLQDNAAHEANYQNRNLVMGLYNAVRSLGMIGGALSAGFFYQTHAMLPFALAVLCFALAAGFMVWHQVSRREEG